MQQKELIGSFGILSNYEYEVMIKHESSAVSFIKKKTKCSIGEAKAELERIKNKIKQHKAFELRQMLRAEKINQARITASIHNTNELLIMSEV